MLGAKLTFLAMGVVIGAMGDSPRLRVARHLQWNGDSNDKVVPQCKAGGPKGLERIHGYGRKIYDTMRGPHLP